MGFLAGTRPEAPRGAIEGPTLEEIVAPETLAGAWRRTRANKGGPGGDGETIEAAAADIETRLAALRSNVLGGSYRPRPVRRAAIPKSDGGRRRLAIPSVIDRVLQTAAMLVLSRRLDGRMSGASWAYREGRGVAGALAELKRAREAGLPWTFDADIKRYFDQVPHERLLEELSIWIDDARIVRLAGLWLRGFSRWGRGVAQGAPISPLLANLFLHPMDRMLEAEGLRLVRYADDFVVPCRSEAEARRAMAIAGRCLAGRGLKLNPRKTRILPPGAGYVFLGEEFVAFPAEAAP